MTLCSPGYTTRTILPTTLEVSNGDPQDKSTHTTKVSFHLIIFDSVHNDDGVFVGLCLVFTLSGVSFRGGWPRHTWRSNETPHTPTPPHPHTHTPPHTPTSHPSLDQQLIVLVLTSCTHSVEDDLLSLQQEWCVWALHTRNSVCVMQMLVPQLA